MQCTDTNSNGAQNFEAFQNRRATGNPSHLRLQDFGLGPASVGGGEKEGVVAAHDWWRSVGAGRVSPVYGLISAVVVTRLI
jgi:hypothetical protein